INEINKFNKDILTKKQIVVINKIDTIKSKKEYNNIKNKITEYLKPSKIELLFISASQDIGLDELKAKLKLLVDY
ncbi:MAG: hypothetical protein ACYDDE_06185, partial [bacterium]